MVPSESRAGQGRIIKGACCLGRRESGFTLIELLIAVAILAVIMTAIYATLFNVLSTRENVQAHMDRLREFRRFSSIFTKEVRASFVNSSDDLSLWRGYDAGSSSAPLAGLSMTFFTYPSGRARSGDLMGVTYRSDETENGLSLYRESWNPYTGESGVKAEVMEDIKGFGVSFYDGDKWVDSWDGAARKAPPEAVRVFIKVEALTGVDTLTATVATMIR